ncbi:MULTISPECIES: hypothetical protein [Pseudomonas syringae group]|uniref:hypothetical protein n=1 Tax=Pseudomonas syringae group TaxID=136849 RepID=UPI0016054572|nr:hypothetical protein [Pseudomonas syringae group genomosp. 3]
MKPVIRQGDTLQEYGGEVLEGHYECQNNCPWALNVSPIQPGKSGGGNDIQTLDILLSEQVIATSPPRPESGRRKIGRGATIDSDMAQLTSVSAAKRQSPGQDSAGLKPARRPSHHRHA